ncbi:hypothetical protein EMPS_05762 [Entomortierella parvispora]|uniref:Uncharacterized protein n=1 Tax=Entomortierella parvispora TaxID=205924 RepID=A0A9P3LWU2_9FUNG|nr:hypothetical protein EMPS_05762 [Entomortierella parvispora]
MTPPLVSSPLSRLRPAFVLVRYNLGPAILSSSPTTAAVSAVAASASANETTKTTLKNLSVSLTTKSANDTLIEYPTGAYTAMRTSEHRGIMDFSCHVNRLANSLSQIQFSVAAMDTEKVEQDKEEEGELEEQGNEQQEVAEALAQFRDAKTLKPLMTDLVREGLRDYYGQVPEESTLGEAKVTVLCSWDSNNRSPIFIAHVEPLKAPKERRCKVMVHGSPRHHATAKDSKWVRDRSKLEADLSKDTNEALLLDEESQDLYEGLSSNFCIYDRKLQSLVTAPLYSVLLGTILKMVIAVCEQEKIPILYKFPNLKNIQDWEGAFISSTSRLVLPIETMIMPDGSEVHFKESSIIDKIRARVQEECRKRVEQIL